VASDVADRDAPGATVARTRSPEPALRSAVAQHEMTVTFADTVWARFAPTFLAARRNPQLTDPLVRFHQLASGFSAINGDVASRNGITQRTIEDKPSTATDDEPFELLELFDNDLGPS
jgi:hypothetical protein